MTTPKDEGWLACPTEALNLLRTAATAGRLKEHALGPEFLAWLDTSIFFVEATERARRVLAAIPQSSEAAGLLRTVETALTSASSAALCVVQDEARAKRAGAKP